LLVEYNAALLESLFVICSRLTKGREMKNENWERILIAYEAGRAARGASEKAYQAALDANLNMHGLELYETFDCVERAALRTLCRMPKGHSCRERRDEIFIQHAARDERLAGLLMFVTASDPDG
jgi:hypothetical protein